MATKVFRLALVNLNALLFVAGFGVLYTGIAAWSRPAANIAAGVLVMTIAALPYLRKP